MAWIIISLSMFMTLWACDSKPLGIDEPEDPPEVIVKKKISIMGDSYSTFEGWSNRDAAGNSNDYVVFYPDHSRYTDVRSVEKTWWYMLCRKPEFELEVSNSYSGSVISNTHYGGVDVSGTDMSFLNRIGKNRLGVDYNGDPDIILVFGGTNDCWAGVEMGNYVYENWTDADLKCFRPAFSKLLSSILELYPEAKIYNITNSGTDGIPGLTRPFVESMQNICEHYNVPNIILKDIAKVENHPTYTGMKAICRQVYAALKNDLVSSVR